jgi:hypothetical protein
MIIGKCPHSVEIVPRNVHSCYLICVPFAVIVLIPTALNYFEEPRKVDAAALFRPESGNRPIMGLAFLTG